MTVRCISHLTELIDRVNWQIRVGAFGVIDYSLVVPYKKAPTEVGALIVS